MKIMSNLCFLAKGKTLNLISNNYKLQYHNNVYTESNNIDKTKQKHH